jgi:hypothetical protein
MAEQMADDRPTKGSIPSTATNFSANADGTTLVHNPLVVGSSPAESKDS